MTDATHPRERKEGTRTASEISLFFFDISQVFEFCCLSSIQLYGDVESVKCHSVVSDTSVTAQVNCTNARRKSEEGGRERKRKTTERTDFFPLPAVFF